MCMGRYRSSPSIMRKGEFAGSAATCAASNPLHPASPMSAVSQKSSFGTSYVNM